MKNYVHVIFLMLDWSVDPRKHLTKEIIEVTKTWSDAILIQLPVSLFVHLFTNFKSKIIGLISRKYKTKKVYGNAILFTPVILFHYNLWLKVKLFALVDVFLLSYQVNRFVHKTFCHKKVLLWVYYPQLFPIINKLKHNFLIYDLQDNYDFDNNGIELKTDSHFNHELIKMSNLVICTANAMYTIAKSINSNSVLIHNGNNFSAFSRPVNLYLKNEISDLNKPIIGYLGGIKNLLDFELLHFLNKNINDVYFVFIGLLYKHAEIDFKKFLKYSNVIWIKYKEPDKLTDYVKRFNVAILPFKINKFTEGVFPNKFYEYMAAEVPIVTTALPDLAPYSEIIGYSNNHQEFLEYCNEALNSKFKAKTSKYLEIAKQNSWFNKAVLINNEILKITENL